MYWVYWLVKKGQMWSLPPKYRSNVVKNLEINISSTFNHNLREKPDHGLYLIFVVCSCVSLQNV